MPIWTPTTDWKDREVFIIGGGDSLRQFNWSLLKQECTIGCNSAFTLGSEVCKICLFGDAKWFGIYKHELFQYAKQGGLVFTNSPQLMKTHLLWLWTIGRISDGLGRKELGWNGHTGASALNLALILGAKKVYLLGFDMILSKEGSPNWHNRLIDEPNTNVYKEFMKRFKRVKVDLAKKFPGRKIINVTNKSALGIFPKIGVEKFWQGRKKAE